MILSLNEVEALAKKATRGVGYPWGLAEEAAKAIRWLHERDVYGCDALVGLLNHRDGTDLSDWSPDPGSTGLTSRGRTLCPIVVGSALSDDAERCRTGDLTIGDVAQPIILAPFIGMAARRLNMSLTLSFGDTLAITDGDALEVEPGPNPAVTTVTIETDRNITRPNQQCSRAQLESGCFDALTRLAQRTYAPATEESRLKGAGAGLSDND